MGCQGFFGVKGAAANIAAPRALPFVRHTGLPRRAGSAPRPVCNRSEAEAKRKPPPSKRIPQKPKAPHDKDPPGKNKTPRRGQPKRRETEWNAPRRVFQTTDHAERGSRLSSGVLRVAPHFQQSQVLIRIFSELQIDRFSIFVFSQVKSQRQISIFKDFQRRYSFQKEIQESPADSTNVPPLPRGGRLQAQLAEITRQVSSPEGDFQIILIQRVISRVPHFQMEPAKKFQPPPPEEGGVHLQSSFLLLCFFPRVFLAPPLPQRGVVPRVFAFQFAFLNFSLHSSSF